MRTLSYDLHLHPAPSARPRWGDGLAVWRAARDAGVRGFVWKAHEEHTIERCLRLPTTPVWPIGSASMNPWATCDSVVDAVRRGALWIWGPTQGELGDIEWNLALPSWWDDLAAWLRGWKHPLVLATGHLAAEGRAALARLARECDLLTCAVTHSLHLSVDEAVSLASLECMFEIDAFTYANPVSVCVQTDLGELLKVLVSAGATVYFTSDGGQRETGNPFVFGAEVLAQVERLVGAELATLIGVENPAAIVAQLRRGL